MSWGYIWIDIQQMVIDQMIDWSVTIQAEDIS